MTAWDRYARMEYARLAIEEEYREEMEMDQIQEYDSRFDSLRESAEGNGGWEGGTVTDENSDSDD